MFKRELLLKKGFALIELSIVMVLIGLIVASVVGGQALVKQAKLRNLISDVNQVKTAMNSFKLQYNALPGDIRNIQSYYPSIQNGNGNRVMEHNTNEPDGFWEVLQVENLYTKYVVGPTPEFLRTNEATPFGQGVYYRIARSDDNVYGSSINQWHLQIGDITSSNNALHQYVTTKDTISIDTKLDDGLAGDGWIKASRNEATRFDSGCIIENNFFKNLTSATYDYSDDVGKCLIFFEVH
ncbi:MAG: prepilin-type N-terminal cleavage/methylation domain-containing protein [Rickettsiales bacterium]|nr:prepilin-type N-terminal cleavage/methylation domain-containing protein [Pseudomonadota bacterium]MDA0965822.1 prepilin-type N-terminal cleavage/methylation domain-containing protein [Pseudomonadota bacterium]MDG4542708.1 prepilin-type N-terminal cleavage/methylation domain-containing protein [Rickettsiales bacterium]MDG4545212.1 prepilin-type N-terminal cleavage/methylation domain-containing protein [Rickettsiales bacterium]MDG4547335.1 prepilin-type N-terminal cleavage/methylation domain-c